MLIMSEFAKKTERKRKREKVCVFVCVFVCVKRERKQLSEEREKTIEGGRERKRRGRDKYLPVQISSKRE